MSFIAKRYIEIVNPEELEVESREYKSTIGELVEMYDLDDMHIVDDSVYYDDDNDLFWIRKDDNGYYVETYQFEREFEVEDSHELEVLCESNLKKINQWFYAITKPEGVSEEEFDDLVFLLLEK